jgi:hypothetical protein
MSEDISKQYRREQVSTSARMEHSLHVSMAFIIMMLLIVFVVMVAFWA